ncbi:MAG: hypothetical protein AB7O74_08785 [Candidatus Nanopelagicales bacterium]
MPIQSRCPSCAAAVPSGAAWCSLCHADLRVRKDPPQVARPVDDVLPSSGRAAAPSVRAQVAEPEPVGRREAGRHARTPEPVGRREAGRRTAGRTSTRTLDPELLQDLELPDGQVAPEQVDQIADRMLARLAVTERAPRMFDPEDVPGGKWTVAGVGAFVMILALLSVFAVLGAVFGR